MGEGKNKMRPALFQNNNLQKQRDVPLKKEKEWKLQVHQNDNYNHDDEALQFYEPGYNQEDLCGWLPGREKKLSALH